MLSSLGASVRMAGTYIGTAVAPLLKDFYADKSVDLSPLHFDLDHPGVMDNVVIAGLARSPMGRFQALFSQDAKWWNTPQEQDIITCKVAAIDPFFREESTLAAELCTKHRIPYVTIDAPHSTYLHQHAAVNIVSGECLHQHYQGMEKEAVFALLQQKSEGLTIITSGGNDMLYGRKGQPMKRTSPFKAEVRSTLGAGDTFKAGCTYALLHKMPDDELVRFASACSGIAISRFPLPLHPPTLEDVNNLLQQK